MAEAWKAPGQECGMSPQDELLSCAQGTLTWPWLPPGSQNTGKPIWLAFVRLGWSSLQCTGFTFLENYFFNVSKPHFLPVWVIVVSPLWGVDFRRFVLHGDELWRIAQPKNFHSEELGFQLVTIPAYSSSSPCCALWYTRFYRKQTQYRPCS